MATVRHGLAISEAEHFRKMSKKGDVIDFPLNPETKSVLNCAYIIGTGRPIKSMVRDGPSEKPTFHTFRPHFSSFHL